MTSAMTADAADWFVNNAATSAQHKTGLVIRLEKAPHQRKAYLDIVGIQKLTGTEWAAKTNLLIEHGISLLERNKR